MLMHADGILMLATSRRFLDSQPIEIDDITLKNEKSQLYFGSVIMNSYNLKDDVDADIKNNHNRHKMLCIFEKKCEWARWHQVKSFAIMCDVIDSSQC